MSEQKAEYSCTPMCDNQKEENEPSFELTKMMDTSGRRLLIRNPELLSQTSIAFKKGELCDIMGLCDVLRKNMTFASSLDLSNQSLDDSMAAFIELMLKTNTTLTSLNLSSNPIGDAFGKAIGKGLEFNTSLTSLTIYHNQRMGDDGITAIARGLMKNSHLKSISFWWGNIQNAGAIAMAEMLKVNTTLTSIGLWGSNLGDDGVRALCKSAETAPLTGFHIRAEKTTNVGIPCICELIRKNNKTMSKLNVEGVQMKGEAVKWICEALRSNSIIREFYTNSNGLDEDSKNAIREAVKARGVPLTMALEFTSKGWNFEKF